MLRNVFLKSLRDQRRALMWWGIGLVALTVLTTLFYPSFRDATGLDELYDQMPEALAKAFAGEFSDFTSPEGFLNSQLLFFIAPLLFLVFGVGFGSGAIAGEEARGTLGLLLSTPVARWQVVAQKFGAMAIVTLVLAVFWWAGLAIGATIVDMELGFDRNGRGHFERRAAGAGLRSVGSGHRLRHRQPRIEHRRDERSRHRSLFS